MILIGFPTQFEAEDFLKMLPRTEKQSVNGIPIVQTRVGEADFAQDIVVAILGMGHEASARRARTLLQHFQNQKVERFILAGFAGALIPELHRGQILAALDISSDDLVNELKLLEGFDFGRLCTVDHVVATAGEKKQIAEQTGAQFVDMETATVAAAAREFNVDILSLRVISDLVDEDLPAGALAAGYDIARSKETPFKLLFYFLLRPWKIPGFIKFMKPLPAVRKKLAQFLYNFILEQTK